MGSVDRKGISRYDNKIFRYRQHLQESRTIESRRITMGSFILFVLFIGYFGYNILQVERAIKGLRTEEKPFLFFFAAAKDIYLWIKSKV